MSKLTGKGSFRGVLFLIEESQGQEGGRRLVVHQYPLRNDALIEDLGKTARSYDVQCLVIGDDHLQQAEKLILALEADGAGTLKHPYFGEKSVFIERYSVTHSTSHERVSRFSFNFYLADNKTAPEFSEDTLFKVVDSYQATLDELANEFDELMSDIASSIESLTDNSLFRLVDTTLNFVDSLFQSVGKVTAAGKAVNKKIQSIHNRIYSLVLQPKVLAKELQSVFALTTQFSAGLRRQKLSRHQVAYRTLSYALAEKRQTELSRDEIKQLAAAKRTHQIYRTKFTAQQSIETLVNSFEGSLNRLCRATLLLNYGNEIAQTLNPQGEAEKANGIELIAKQDVTRYLNELQQYLDEMTLEFADKGFWASYNSLNQFRLVLISDLRTRGQQLKNSRQIVLRETAPALAVLFAQTGNAAKWQQFCERNSIRHPLFVIGGKEVEVIDE
ncbi:DNA circularization protein [[Haemophilus] felis]|uniref:DNA circulation N-terminal domain-containing protein n=1 Tax=[Haemophilus] felis TaxID=123822 RepID=A0A1T0B6K6_9PAST|nr:DNA circularization protein [[Haemophilus] felis]OOS05840.1 hypothetical protein B0188_03435 [[Haemophilus] felis]